MRFILFLLMISTGLHAAHFRIHKSIPSRFLNRKRHVIVLLPPDYKNSGKRYPVLYAHDGQNLFHKKTSFSGEWRLDENITALQKEGLLKGVIVVGIYNTTARIDEYTPSHIKPGINKYLKNGGGGRLRAYARFIVEELKPLIDRKYRTFKGRKHSGVMGSSLGGLASFYILGWYPKIFSRAACISPSFWWDKQRVLKDFPGLHFPGDVKIYLDGGWKEGADESTMVKSLRLIKKALNRRGLQDLRNIFYHEDPEGTHSEGSWARRGRWPILYLFGRFLSTAKQVKIQLSPKRIGVGDSSTPLAQLIFSGGIPFTRFDRIYLAPTTRAILRKGKMHGLKSGETILFLHIKKKMYTQAITVLPESRDTVRIRITLTGKNGPFFLERQNKTTKKWKSKPFRKTAAHTGIIIIKNRSGQRVRIRFRNSRGALALTKTGQKLAPVLTFSTSQSIRLILKNWSSR